MDDDVHVVIFLDVVETNVAREIRFMLQIVGGFLKMYR